MSTPVNSSVTISRDGVVVTQSGEGSGATGGVSQTAFNTLAGRVSSLEVRSHDLPTATLSTLDSRVTTLESHSHEGADLSNLESRVTELETNGSESANAVVYDTSVGVDTVFKFPFDSVETNTVVGSTFNRVASGPVDDFAGFTGVTCGTNLTFGGNPGLYNTTPLKIVETEFGNKALMIGDDSRYSDPENPDSGFVFTHPPPLDVGTAFLPQDENGNPTDTYARYYVTIPNIAKTEVVGGVPVSLTHRVRARLIASSQEDGVVYPGVFVDANEASGPDTEGDFAQVYVGERTDANIVKRLSGDKNEVFEFDIAPGQDLHFEYAKHGNRSQVYYDVAKLIIEEVTKPLAEPVKQVSVMRVDALEATGDSSVYNLDVTGTLSGPSIDQKATKAALATLSATVDTKADQSNLVAVSDRVEAYENVFDLKEAPNTIRMPIEVDSASNVFLHEYPLDGSSIAAPDSNLVLIANVVKFATTEEYQLSANISATFQYTTFGSEAANAAPEVNVYSFANADGHTYIQIGDAETEDLENPSTAIDPTSPYKTTALNTHMVLGATPVGHMRKIVFDLKVMLEEDYDRVRFLENNVTIKEFIGKHDTTYEYFNYSGEETTLTLRMFKDSGYRGYEDIAQFAIISDGLYPIEETLKIDAFGDVTAHTATGKHSLTLKADQTAVDTALALKADRILTSPDGTQYVLSVSNDGTLSTTLA